MAKRNLEMELRRAIACLQQGDIEQARAIYRQLADRFPRDNRPRQALAEIDRVIAPPVIAPDPPRAQADALIGLFNQGRFAEVMMHAEALVQHHPGSFFLWNILGIASARCRRIDRAVAAFGKACTLNPALPDAHANYGHALKEHGDFEAAIVSYRRALALKPDLGAIHCELGNGLAALGRLDEAASALRSAITLMPEFADAHSNLGNVLMALGRLDEAAQCYGRALALKPDFAGVHYNLGGLYVAQGRPDAAIGAYKHALALKPDFVEAHCNLGNVLKEQGRLNEAAAEYEGALQYHPGFVDAVYNLGSVRSDQGRIDDAVACYERVLALSPDHVDAHYNLSIARKAQGRADEALAACARALALKPDFAEAYNNLGNLHYLQGNLEEAFVACVRALTLKPGFADAHNNLGVVLVALGRLDEAVASFRRAIAIQPDLAAARAQMLHQQYHMCDWQGFAQLAADCAALGSQPQGVPPFCLLSLADDAALQLRLARIWADETCKHKAPAIAARPTARPQRLRIGYFSADFHDHATLFLMAGLLRAHDRARFEVCAYSYGRDPAGDLGERARRDVDRFIDIAGQPSRAVADLVHGHGLDIAIDLKGYTAHGRLDLFQYRLAPVQISYLGYPGPLGADFIDYIVADPVVIPDAARAFYNESVIRLPHSYQPNDNTRAIAATQTGRADFGLPEHGVVLCCFNNSYKITPREFDIWMRLLGRVEGSVLWLLKANRWCEDNLRREAAARGIAPERLVFAERVGQAEHLARHKHADLFVDTFNCNAHTTSSDALWAGLPVVTRAGQQFAARVSASLLTAVGLPDLITHSDADYEALIFALATDPARLAAIRARLSANRLTQPLFDTVQYTRHFEAGLERAYERFFAGLAPHDIQVAP